MAFRSTIDNDTVAALPVARFEGSIVIVDKPEQIEAACDDLKRHAIIGFDTETRPSFRAGGTIAALNTRHLLPLPSLARKA